MSRPRVTSTSTTDVTVEIDGTIERVTTIGPGRYLYEVLTPDERVVSSRPISRREAETLTGGATAAVPARPVKFTVERALLRLLWEHLGEPVGHREVTAVVGHEVTRQAVWKAAQRLARSLPIEAVKGPHGGYRLPLPKGRAES